jgi:hypothetical protein
VQPPRANIALDNKTINYRKEKPMFTKSVKRLLVTVGVTAGFIAVAASQASAAMNHSEPTLNRN